MKIMQDNRNIPIEIVDQLEETPMSKGLSLWLLIPTILAGATGIFFVVRAILAREN